MKTPKMIIFDYGHTLLCEPQFDLLRGEEALFNYVQSNKNNITAKQAKDFSAELFEKIGTVRELGMELHEWQFQRFLYEYLEIELTVSLPEAEKIFWDNVSAGEMMPNVDIMIDYINQHNIRSAVISNIGFSGAALTDRINRLLPRNKFEFIIASSEYMFRKPNALLFELALKKAELDSSEVWYCGDNIKADIEGSSAVGIYPVWYEDKTTEIGYGADNSGLKPSCEHLHINDWLEMVELLEDLSYS